MTIKTVWLATLLAALPAPALAQTSNDPPGRQMQAGEKDPGASGYARDTDRNKPPGREMLKETEQQPGASKYAPGQQNAPSSPGASGSAPGRNK